jgi:hypothetical protein
MGDSDNKDLEMHSVTNSPEIVQSEHVSARKTLGARKRKASSSESNESGELPSSDFVPAAGEGAKKKRRRSRSLASASWNEDLETDDHLSREEKIVKMFSPHVVVYQTSQGVPDGFTKVLIARTTGSKQQSVCILGPTFSRYWYVKDNLPSKPLTLDLMETLDLFFRRACYH